MPGTYCVTLDFVAVDSIVKGIIVVHIKRAEKIILDEDTKSDLWAFQ